MASIGTMSKKALVHMSSLCPMDWETSKSMSMTAASGFTVTSFDMPGMSRSSDTPAETYEQVTPRKLASYVISICSELNIQQARFWAYSSGGSTMLALVADYPERVRNAMAHEVPTYEMPHLLALEHMSDDEISQTMVQSLTFFMGNAEAWVALSEDFHARLWKNFPRWGRGHFRTLGGSFPVNKDDL